MGTPMPALCMGPGLWRLAGGEWRPTGEGGQLYLADGMFDVSYGPCGGTLLDGNLLHGVTNLRDFSGTGQTSRPELERFSLIIFSEEYRIGARGFVKAGSRGQLEACPGHAECVRVSVVRG